MSMENEVARAYLIIKPVVGKEEDLEKRLRNYPEVRKFSRMEAVVEYSIPGVMSTIGWNSMDHIVTLQTDSMSSLKDVVLKIRDIKEIHSTMTLFCIGKDLGFYRDEKNEYHDGFPEYENNLKKI